MFRVVLCTVLIGAATWASMPGAAWADPAPATDKKQVAKQYVKAGDAAQKAGDFDTAIELYEKAYQLVPHPVLIFDIAQALRHAGRLDEALRQYKRFVAIVPSGEDAETARDFIAEIETTLANSAPAAHDTPGGDSQRTDRSMQGAGENSGAVTNAAGATQAASASAGEHPLGDAHASPAGGNASERTQNARDAVTVEASPGRTLRLLGLASGGTGVAALAVGIGFGLHARTLSNQVSTQFDHDRYAAGGRANDIAITGFVSGGVLIATGAVLYAWGHAQDRGSEKAVVAPVLSDHSVGLAVLGCWP